MIEFDPAKNLENRRKHGVPLELAVALDWTAAKQRPDRRYDYGEERIIAIAPIGGRLFVCVYTWRGEIRRIVSLRKANRREVNAYRQANT